MKEIIKQISITAKILPMLCMHAFHAFMFFFIFHVRCFVAISGSVEVLGPADVFLNKVLGDRDFNSSGFESLMARFQ